MPGLVQHRHRRPLHVYALRRYHANTSLLLAAVKGRLKWAEGAEVKRELDAQVAALLGPKTEADLAKPDKKKAKKVGPALPVRTQSMHSDIMRSRLLFGARDPGFLRVHGCP